MEHLKIQCDSHTYLHLPEILQSSIPGYMAHTGYISPICQGAPKASMQSTIAQHDYHLDIHELELLIQPLGWLSHVATMSMKQPVTSTHNSKYSYPLVISHSY